MAEGEDQGNQKMPVLLRELAYETSCAYELVWARRFRPIFRLPRLWRAWLLTLLLWRAVLRRCSLLALLLPVAELVLVFPGLGCVSFLNWWRGPCLGM